MAALRIRVFRDFASMQPLENAILELNLASRRPSAFDTLQYLRIAWDNEEFATKGREPLLLAAFEGERLVGFLPLRRTEEHVLGLSETVVEFALTHDTDRLRVVARPEDEERCAAAFYAHLLGVERNVHFINLMEQDGDSKLFPVPAAATARFRVRSFPNGENATVALTSTLDDYMGTLSPSSRRDFRKQCRRLLKSARITWIGSDEPLAARALLDIHMDVEKHMWKDKVSGTIGRDAARVAFFKAKMAAGLPFEMFVDVLLYDGAPVAGAIGGHFARSTWLKDSGYDEGFRRVAPGNLMMLMRIARSIERGSTTLNMLRDQGYYKTRWGATMSPTALVQIYRRLSMHHTKATLGDLGRRFGVLHAPVAPLDHNPDRKAVMETDDVAQPLPDRSAEAARAAVVLANIRAQGLRVTELDSAALLDYLNLNAKEKKSAHVA